MNKLLYACSVPIIAITLGFESPEIDLNHNIRKTQQKGTESNNKKERLESPRTREGYRDLRGRIREKYAQRRIAQFYVNSWFVASFSLDLDDNILLRVKDVYAKAISEVGLTTKGYDSIDKGKSKKLRKIHSTFDRELRKTLDVKQYKKLKDMTEPNYRSKKIDKGET